MQMYRTRLEPNTGIRSAQDPMIDYTKALPDLKHHGQAMRSSMRTEWIKSQNLEIQGLWSRDVS